MKRLIHILIFILLSVSFYGQNSGYMGKKIFVDAAIRLDPLIDENAKDFGLGYDISLGRTISDRTALAVNYTVVNRTDYNSTYLGLNLQIYRSSYIAPVGKMWFIGGGKFNFDENQRQFSFGGTDPNKRVKGKATYLNVGHEYRTIIKGGNLYFITQFVAGVFIDRFEEFSYFAERGVNLSGKLGFGIVL